MDKHLTLNRGVFSHVQTGKDIDMKYNAKKLEDWLHSEDPDGEYYAVFTGRKYFTDTVTTNKKDAERSAITMSMQYHYNEATRIYVEAEEAGVDFQGANFGDILC